MMDIEARREARRRKILANADKRLKRITNIQTDEVPSEEHVEHNLKPINTETMGEFIEEIPVEEDPTDVEFTEIFQNGNFPIPTETNVARKSDKKNTQVIVLVGLAIFTRLLQLLVGFFASSDTDNHVANKVFVPFFLYEFMEVFVIKTEIPPVGLINFLLFFGNIPPHVSKKIIEVFNLFSKVIQDGLIFFFVYVIADLVVGQMYE